MSWSQWLPAFASVSKENGFVPDASVYGEYHRSPKRHCRIYGESILHELVHATLLGGRDRMRKILIDRGTSWDDIPAVVQRIGTALISTVIEKTMSKSQADDHELEVLAVELKVGKFLGVPICRVHLLDYASVNLKTYHVIDDEPLMPFALMSLKLSKFLDSPSTTKKARQVYSILLQHLPQNQSLRSA